MNNITAFSNGNDTLGDGGMNGTKTFQNTINIGSFINDINNQ